VPCFPTRVSEKTFQKGSGSLKCGPKSLAGFVSFLTRKFPEVIERNAREQLHHDVHDVAAREPHFVILRHTLEIDQSWRAGTA